MDYSQQATIASPPPAYPQQQQEQQQATIASPPPDYPQQQQYQQQQEGTASPTPPSHSPSPPPQDQDQDQEDSLIDEIISELDRERTRRAELEEKLKQYQMKEALLEECEDNAKLELQSILESVGDTNQQDERVSNETRDELICDSQVKQFELMNEIVELTSENQTLKDTLLTLTTPNAAIELAKESEGGLGLDIIKLLETTPWKVERGLLSSTDFCYEWQVLQATGLVSLSSSTPAPTQ
jgi:hypothetical protein